jgi:hypothetical protein
VIYLYYKVVHLLRKASDESVTQLLQLERFSKHKFQEEGSKFFPNLESYLTYFRMSQRRTPQISIQTGYEFVRRTLNVGRGRGGTDPRGYSALFAQQG